MSKIGLTSKGHPFLDPKAPSKWKNQTVRMIAGKSVYVKNDYNAGRDMSPLAFPSVDEILIPEIVAVAAVMDVTGLIVVVPQIVGVPPHFRFEHSNATRVLNDAGRKEYRVACNAIIQINDTTLPEDYASAFSELYETIPSSVIDGLQIDHKTTFEDIMMNSKFYSLWSTSL